MTSVLHPVGPEPSQTYWVRRLVVIASAVLVLAIVVVLIINGTSRGSAVQADPAPPAAAPVPASTPTPTDPTPSTMSSSMRTPGGSPSASSSASPSAKTSASAKATTTASATPSSTATSKATPKASPKPSATKSAKPVKPAGPVACKPSELRPTLTGKPRLKPKQKGTFALSLINGSDQTCTVGLTAKNFELKIYSGKDRIWSTDDCATAVKPVTGKLKSQEAVTWSMTWDGRRSKADCKQRPEIPRPGTYVATAQLTGAKPVQLRFFLRK